MQRRINLALLAVGLPLGLVVLIAYGARSDGIAPGGLGFQDGINNGGGAPGPAPPAVDHFRITNTGSFRITSTGDSRVISP